ncbi:hypothetical protein [Alloprevotella rava]|uniref:Uncharacterized protein n=1 Tax=Alloprevotella rava TaxID=671218 RepID=A0A7W5UEE1_9BACT|nr:hypothetical protein [Alloprevotella rava]MBB3702528.1 hypothetical protein [Alloprevotella rava]
MVETVASQRPLLNLKVCRTARNFVVTIATKIVNRIRILTEREWLQNPIVVSGASDSSDSSCSSNKPIGKYNKAIN